MTFPAWLAWMLLLLPCGATPVCKCGIAPVDLPVLDALAARATP